MLKPKPVLKILDDINMNRKLHKLNQIDLPLYLNWAILNPETFKKYL